MAGGGTREPDDQGPGDRAGHRRRSGSSSAKGINVNATLLFARDAYEQVAEAYIAGLERFAAGGGDPARVAGVASFFVSRIDTAIDAIDRRSGCRRPPMPARASAAAIAAGQGRDRQRQARLPALPRDLQRPALAAAGRPGRADATAALGQHRHQEPGLSATSSTSRS